MLDAADGQAEGGVDPPHPLGVAAGEVVIDRDDVRPTTGQGVQGDGKGGDERLALARPHFGDFPLVEDRPAPKLDVVVTLAEGPLAGLPHEREDAGKEGVDDGTGPGSARLEIGGKVLQFRFDPLADLTDPRPQAVQGEVHELGLEEADLLDERGEGPHVAVVLRPEDLGECLVDDHLSSMGAPGGRESEILAEGAGVSRRPPRVLVQKAFRT